MIKQHLRKSAFYILLALALAALLHLTSNVAQGEEGEEKAAEKSLYERLGGYDAVAAVIDDFFKRMIGDEQLGRFFIGLSNDSKQRAQQLTVEFVCRATGGPCLYVGRDMETTHEGLGINESDWEVAAKHLVATLDKFKVPEKEKNEVLTLVTSLKGTIVEEEAAQE